MQLILTCEHGGNRVPARYVPLFKGRRRMLASHLSFDPGARELAEAVARALSASCHTSTLTRLLIDLNRSPGHPRLFSDVTRNLDRAEKEAILGRYYYPYRNAVEADLSGVIGSGMRALHIAVHTFVPVMDGRERRADVGILYDPSRKTEAALGARWRNALTALRPSLRVRRNYPYLGRTDGLVTWFRKRHSGHRYIGIELEVNQKFPLAGDRSWRDLKRAVIRSLRTALEEGDS